MVGRGAASLAAESDSSGVDWPARPEGAPPVHRPRRTPMASSYHAGTPTAVGPVRGGGAREAGVAVAGAPARVKVASPSSGPCSVGGSRRSPPRLGHEGRSFRVGPVVGSLAAGSPGTCLRAGVPRHRGSSRWVGALRSRRLPGGHVVGLGHQLRCRRSPQDRPDGRGVLAHLRDHTGIETPYNSRDRQTDRDGAGSASDVAFLRGTRVGPDRPNSRGAAARAAVPMPRPPEEVHRWMRSGSTG